MLNTSLPDRPGSREFFAVRDVGDWDLGQHLQNVDVGDPIRCLAGDNKLNDENINMYFDLLSSGECNPAGSDALFCNSHIYGQLVRDGVPKFAACIDKMRTPNFTRVFLPVFIESEPKHWFLIVVDFDKRTIVSMDSAWRVDREAYRDTVMGWVEYEWNSSERWKGRFRKSRWENGDRRVPIQRNAVDCGVYTCLFAAFVSNRVEIKFQPSRVPIARKRIAWSICHKKL